MRKQDQLKMGVRGITLTEIVVVLALIGIIAPLGYWMYRLVLRSFATIEVRGHMNGQSQKALNDIGHMLTECKRIFHDNSATDKALLARLQLSRPVITSSRLPKINEEGSISPNDVNFSSTSVGNSLFFAGYARPQNVPLNVVASTSPLLFSAAGVGDVGPVSFSPAQESGTLFVSTYSVRIDIYVFRYFYVARDPSSTVAGQEKRDLWGWESVRMADYQELMTFPPSIRNNIMTNLQNANIKYAWDASNQDPNSIYTLPDLTPPGDVTSPLVPAATGPLIDTRGLVSGLRYGVSPNTSGDIQIPLYANAGDPVFPSGFEVVVVGSRSVRQIFIRLVLAANGPFPKTVFHQQTVAATARDIW